MMVQNQMDNDDCIRLRYLADQFNKATLEATAGLSKWLRAETKLDKAIILNRVKDTLAWKKQVIALITTHPEYDSLHTEFMDGKEAQKVADYKLKAIENEMNALKKVFEETPD